MSSLYIVSLADTFYINLEAEEYILGNSTIVYSNPTKVAKLEALVDDFLSL